MEHTWRWFGPNDPISLDDVRQTGATGIVSALHEMPIGEVWPIAAIEERKALIESHGLTWSVVESISVHEDIKLNEGDAAKYIDNFAQTIRNLAACGIDTVCYNFMPVLNWTRTELEYERPSGSKALLFDFVDYCAFDLFIVERPDAADDYTDEQRKRAEQRYRGMSDAQVAHLVHNLVAGMPANEGSYSLEEFKRHIQRYARMSRETFRQHFLHLLERIVPVAEECGVRLAIHPDDPPFSLCGLPRIVSTEEDAAWILAAVDSPANGLTFCTGSYGSRLDNDLPRMIERFAERIYFTHLRATKTLEDGISFFEDDHLAGNIDMVGIVDQLLTIESRRRQAGDHRALPMRPDHGQKVLDDNHKASTPGYPAIGRLKGLAELRGVEQALRYAKDYRPSRAV
ncbi:MAG: mannonate dehydratase [Salinicola sp.]|uniref:mannonate dehydratase n=1 Tax=Salinicola sp. TaxID=1978524 RepID=UPI001D2574D7|nr:mannonate dehydratase [Salinicola sp.]NRB54713.1 mannonate dehydratase [Salinicola sp.]